MSDVFILEEFPRAPAVLRRTSNGRLVLHHFDSPTSRSKTICGLDPPDAAITVPAGREIYVCRKCDEGESGRARIERLT